MEPSHDDQNGGPVISLIAAMARNRVIGVDGRLPWRLPAEMRWFRQMTLNKPVLMGRRTYESIGRPLPRRYNLILTHQTDYVASGCTVVHSLTAALQAVRAAPELMVIGGASLYHALLPAAGRLYLSIVAAEMEGDVFFPQLAWEAWRVVWESWQPADAENSYAFQSCILERRSPLSGAPTQ